MIDMSGNIFKLDEWQMHEDAPFYEGTERAPRPLSSGWWFYRAEPGSWIIELYIHLKWRCHISIAARLVARCKLGQFRLKIPCSPWCAVVACGACPYFCSAWDGSDCRYGGFWRGPFVHSQERPQNSKSLFWSETKHRSKRMQSTVLEVTLLSTLSQVD